MYTYSYTYIHTYSNICVRSTSLKKGFKGSCKNKKKESQRVQIDIQSLILSHKPLEQLSLFSEVTFFSF